ncbi:MAG: metallophosphoesterase [Thermoanaerobaculia bacterium]
MNRLVWATDLHLDTVAEADIEDFCSRVAQTQSEALLLGGDLGQAGDLEYWLDYLVARIQLPTYFVLGNHDYYGSDIATIRGRIRQLDLPLLHWLPDTGCVELGEDTALVGHGGWGDARLGDLEASPVVLTDYLAIKDLADEVNIQDLVEGSWDKFRLKRKLAKLGDEAAACLRGPLVQALERFARVIVLTHVPPFREACWHRGRISDDNWLPSFTCKAVGDLILSCAESRPDCQITVLCGHTHGSGKVQILPNLSVYTAEAAYGQIGFQLIELGNQDPATGHRQLRWVESRRSPQD